MEQREKEILEKINAKAEHVKIPEGLEPENIEPLLSAQNNQKKRKIFNMRFVGVAATCILLISGGILLRSFLVTDENSLAIPPMSQNQENKSTVDQKDILDKSILATASNYDEIYDYLQNDIARYNTGMEYGRDESDDGGEVTSSQDVSPSSEMATEEEMVRLEEDDYSDTNVREQGVGEADYVKTDGTYLYVRKDNMNKIEIVDTREPQMKSVGSIHIPNATIQEFYIQDKKIVALCEASQEEDNVYGSTIFTKIVTYDISAPEEPKKLGEVVQSGSYYTSRFSGDYLYIFSQFYAASVSTRNQIQDYIPFIDGDAIAAERILMPTASYGNLFMVISSVNINEPDKIVDSKAAFSNGGQCYVSSENIYIYEYKYGIDPIETWNSSEQTSSRTTIRKISYKDGVLSAEAQNTINGYLDSSFSIDEYKGYLRTVVTVDGEKETTSAVYVMDKALEIIGKIEGLAKDERVYSARFMGDTGYFVTFRETDPLFSVDLSDPENPRIIGKLKIPGFSEYLHVYKEGLLLGIGMDVDEETQVTDGVKISMFDISDPSNVTEVNKYVIKNSYHSDVFYDYKAVLINSDKDIIGFSVMGSQEIYHIFGFNEKAGFTNKMEQEVNGTSYATTRGVYINDTLYVVKGNIVESYSLNDYKKIADIIL